MSENLDQHHKSVGERRTAPELPTTHHIASAASPAQASRQKLQSTVLLIVSVLAIVLGIFLNNIEKFAPSATAPVSFQTGKIVGRERTEGLYRVRYDVSDEHGRPIVGADVRIFGDTAISDSSGMAEFESITQGDKLVRVHARNYQRATDRITVGEGESARDMTLYPIYSKLDVTGMLMVIAGGCGIMLVAIDKLLRSYKA